MVKYCVANECPIDTWACASAAENGHLEVLKYLREEAKAPWDEKTATWAAQNGHLHILEYLVERKYDEYNAWACENAARNGHLDCLKYLHETAKAPWNSDVVRNYRTIDAAAEQGNLEMVKYCVANECPYRCVCVCMGCRKRSSRVPQILTRRSQSALGILILPLGRL